MAWLPQNGLQKVMAHKQKLYQIFFSISRMNYKETPLIKLKQIKNIRKRKPPVYPVDIQIEISGLVGSEWASDGDGG